MLINLFCSLNSINVWLVRALFKVIFSNLRCSLVYLKQLLSFKNACLPTKVSKSPVLTNLCSPIAPAPFCEDSEPTALFPPKVIFSLFWWNMKIDHFIVTFIVSENNIFKYLGKFYFMCHMSVHPQRGPSRQPTL